MQNKLLLMLCCIAFIACGKTPAIKVTASGTKTVSLSGIGSLTAKLEIREQGDKALGVVLYTWTGKDLATVSTSVSLYRFDTNKLEELQRTDAAFDLDTDESKAVSTDSTTEMRRRCAVLTITATSFDVDGVEKTNAGNTQICEKG
jgi:hypothetical protein